MHGVYDVLSVPSCEPELRRNPNNETLKMCDIRFTKNQQPLWEPRITSGSWLYSLIHSKMVYLNCPEREAKAHTLSGVGIVHVARECVLKFDTIELPSLQIKENPYKYLYKSKLELKLENVSLKLKDVGWKAIAVENDNKWFSWKKSDSEEKLKRLEKEFEERSHHVLNKEINEAYSPTMIGVWSTVTIIVILATVLIIMIKCRKRTTTINNIINEKDKSNEVPLKDLSQTTPSKTCQTEFKTPTKEEATASTLEFNNTLDPETPIPKAIRRAVTCPDVKIHLKKQSNRY